MAPTPLVTPARLEPMLALLEELVLINSYTGNAAGGALVADVLTRELTRAGLHVERIPSATHAPHLCASSPAARASSSGCVAVVGHLDTVFPPGRFEGFRRDGELVRGPGVVDMKGGLCVAIEALRALAPDLARLPVRYLIVSDEEIGSPEGAGVIAAQLGGAACALVLEAGRKADAVITRRKGTGNVRAVASGRPAHAGNAHADGANAIWALARFVDRAQALTDYDRGVTVNVGTIAGGQGRNTVPDQAESLLDLRFVTRADGEALLEELRHAAAGAAVPGTRVELLGGLARPPLERSDANAALYREYAACARAAGLGDGECPLVGGGSDAATTAALGIPSIDGLGPRGSGFHTPDERAEIATFVPKADALARFLRARVPAADPG